MSHRPYSGIPERRLPPCHVDRPGATCFHIDNAITRFIVDGNAVAIASIHWKHVAVLC